MNQSIMEDISMVHMVTHPVHKEPEAGRSYVAHTGIGCCVELLSQHTSVRSGRSLPAENPVNFIKS